MIYIFAWCRNKGISFVAIDQNRPLSDQGPFDVVLHKVGVDLFFTETPTNIFFKNYFLLNFFFLVLLEADSICVILNLYLSLGMHISFVCNWNTCLRFGISDEPYIFPVVRNGVVQDHWGLYIYTSWFCS